METLVYFALTVAAGLLAIPVTVFFLEIVAAIAGWSVIYYPFTQVLHTGGESG